MFMLHFGNRLCFFLQINFVFAQKAGILALFVFVPYIAFLQQMNIKLLSNCFTTFQKRPQNTGSLNRVTVCKATHFFKSLFSLLNYGTLDTKHFLFPRNKNFHTQIHTHPFSILNACCSNILKNIHDERNLKQNKHLHYGLNFLSYGWCIATRANAVLSNVYEASTFPAVSK